MQNFLKFEVCFSQLLNILNISGNKLAKALNVDPSLISKWKNGKRKICTDSNYIELISNYLADNIVNNQQKEKIVHLYNSFNLSISDESSYNMRKYIHEILTMSTLNSSCSQNNILSIEYIGKNYYDSMVNTKNKNTQNLQHISEIDNGNHNFFNASNKIRGKYGYISNSEIIIGNENIIYAGIDLLKTLPKKPSYVTEPILISFFTEMDSFSNYEETYHQWNEILLETQKKGWNIKKIARLSENITKNKSIIKELLMNLEHDRYALSYLNKHDAIINFKEFLVIPTVGILVCHCSEIVNKIDIAFLLKDKHSFNFMRNVFNNYINHSSSVINNKYNTDDINLTSEITVSEESNGDRFTLNHYLNEFIMPLGNTIEYFSSKEDNTSVKQFSETVFFQKRRLDAFNKKTKNYRYYDIWSKKFIENLIRVNEGKLNNYKTQDVLVYMQNIINTLEDNDNYQIALLNDNNIENSYDISYMIKDSHTVFVQNHFRNATLVKANSNHDVCISITEPTIVDAFNHHFIDLWNKISPVNKNKASVISWIKSQIKVLDIYNQTTNFDSKK